MITFHVLGALDLRGPGGRPLGSTLTGSKRLALLAYLALAGRGRGLARRDTLLGLFWPDLDQSHARNSLSNMLHHIRKALGPDAVVTRGREAIGLREDYAWCDATAFETALDEGRRADALELYRGDLLEGLFVSDASPEFDQWLDGERSRLRRRATEAARTLAEQAEQEGRTEEAIRWTRRVTRLDPFDEPAARQLVMLLDRSGDRAGALRSYEQFASRVAREFDAEPSPETRAAVAGIRQRGGLASAGSSVQDAANSIAVLPFEDLSGTAAAEPFAMGLHGDLLTELSRVSALRVIARASVARYRGTHTTVQEIAHELNVDTIVEGGVQTDGDRLRLTVRMIDARSGSQRWAERYDRALSGQGILDLQVELAEKITRALQGELTPVERARGPRESTENLEAYRLCAQGRAYLDQRTAAGMHRSVDFFERAVALDPGYALAWVGLADALSLLRDYEYEPAERVLPRAEQAVRKALELAPDMAEAHTSLGEFHVARRDGPSAIRALTRAVELRSGYAEAHNWLGWMSQVMGDGRQALASAERAAALDPLSPETISNLSLSLLTNGRVGEALRFAARTRELQPDWTTGPFYEGLCHYHMGRFAEAASALEGLTVEWAGSGPVLTLALACVARGAEDRAREILGGLEAADDRYAVGLIRLALGERDAAREALRAAERWDYWPSLSMHHFYPELFAEIAGDPIYAWMRQQRDLWWRGQWGSQASPILTSPPARL